MLFALSLEVAHSGKYILPSKPGDLDVQVSLLIHPPMNHYIGSYNRGIRSRKWGEHDRFTFSVSKVTRIRIEMLPARRKPVEVFVREMKKFRLNNQKRNIVNMQRYTGVDCGEHVDEVTVCYNKCNEPVLRYGISFFADRGVSMQCWTSYRLRSKCVFFECDSVRYELSRTPSANRDSTIITGGDGSATSTAMYDIYRFAKCKRYRTKEQLLTPNTLPLKAPDECEVLESGLDWQEIVFAPSCIYVRGKKYDVACFWWLALEPKKRDAKAAKESSGAVDVNYHSDFSSEGDEDVI